MRKAHAQLEAAKYYAKLYQEKGYPGIIDKIKRAGFRYRLAVKVGPIVRDEI